MPFSPTLLSRRRTASGLTQAELAERLKIHRVTVAKLESGLRQPSLDLLERLARALSCRVEKLLD